MSLWNLGADPIMVWDESRNGVTASEMIANKDYLNLHYGGRPDDWSVKPPLFIWTVALSFQAFGQSTFALRLPSAIASIIALYWLFQICRLYRSSSFALVVGLVLLSVKGFLGPHVGRSGDYDALLVCLLLGGLYYCLRFLDFKYTRGAYLTAILWGLAFWTKGPAAFIFFPGIFLLLLYKKQWKLLLSNPSIWKAGLLFFAICGSWVFAIYHYGATFQTSSFAGSNAFQRIFLNDILHRFSSSTVDGAIHPKDYTFFFTYLDARFNLWNYLFYLSLLIFLITPLSITAVLRNKKIDPLLLLAFSLTFTLALFFTFASTKHHWYMAPALPFIAIITVNGLEQYWPRTKYLLIGLLAFTLGRQFYQFSTPPNPPTVIQSLQQQLSSQKGLGLVLPFPRQDKMWHLYTQSKSVIHLQDFDQLDQNKNIDQLYIHRNHLISIDSTKWQKKLQVNEHLLLDRID